ncbi:MAG: hypothetical protein FWF81_02570 [Defluviitaleaceae bacterium]|nr:hypothetical protein [Defluviitaleaceae bacterium]
MFFLSNPMPDMRTLVDTGAFNTRLGCSAHNTRCECLEQLGFYYFTDG